MFIRGEEVDRFEENYAKLHGVKYCISWGMVQMRYTLQSKH